MKNLLKGVLAGLIVGILISFPFINIWCNRFIFKLCPGDNCGCSIEIPILISVLFFALLGLLVAKLSEKKKKK